MDSECIHARYCHQCERRCASRSHAGRSYAERRVWQRRSFSVQEVQNEISKTTGRGSPPPCALKREPVCPGRPRSNSFEVTHVSIEATPPNGNGSHRASGADEPRQDDGGFFKVYRKLFTEHWLGRSKPYCQGFAFLYLVAEAAFKDHRDGRGDVQRRGEVLTSQGALAKQFGWGRNGDDRKRVREFLKRLQADEMIVLRTNTRRDSGHTRIKIVNYEKYQAQLKAVASSFGISPSNSPSNFIGNTVESSPSISPPISPSKSHHRRKKE